MTFADLITSQLMDPFRIGLLGVLVATTRRTAAHTGNWIPLGLGALFVAVLIPTTRGGEQIGLAIGAGIVANVVILAVILGAILLWKQLAGGKTN